MNDREKLVELLTEFYGCDPMYYGDDALTIAQYLVDRGVTVPQWISVKERLPEIGRSVIIYNATAKYAAEAMHKGEGRFLQFRWSAKLQEQEVTHWMLMPQPPKGE